MEIAYFPGCTLKTTAKALEDSALAIAKELEIDIKEMPSWTCCGTCYSLAKDDLMKQVAPVRNLARVANLGHSVLTTLCSICYNTLAQANLFVKADSVSLEKLNTFMEEEPDYTGNVEVKHFLTILKEFGVENISKAVKKPLLGLKVACYYGCLLLRPHGVEIDDPEHPSILETIMQSIGAEPVYFPYQVECCGSYHIAIKPEIITKRAYLILENAKENGADIIVTSCPLCFFNLKDRQKDIKVVYPDFKEIPVFYFTEVIAEAFGIIKVLKGI